jgi:NAD(P)-dependent dehydrogenase (short-subunit alcohol dehydrogenase family)
MVTAPGGGRTAVVIGAGGLGRPLAARLIERGADVYVTSRDGDRAAETARQLGPRAHGLAVDLTHPESIVGDLASIPSVDHLVVTATEQHDIRLDQFDVHAAANAVVAKLVGYPETVRALKDRFMPAASIVLFGGLAKERPYPGSTIVTTYNQGVSGLVRTLAIELAPHRINAIHPGLVGDSPRWAGIEHPLCHRAPIGRLVTVAEVVHATEFLLDNTGIDGHDLYLDGGLVLA